MRVERAEEQERRALIATQQVWHRCQQLRRQQRRCPTAANAATANAANAASTTTNAADADATRPAGRCCGDGVAVGEEALE